MGNSVSSFLYKKIIRNILFQFDAELVHGFITRFAELMGKTFFLKRLLKLIYVKNYPLLRQKVAGIEFKSPLGMAAGFDYEARLTQILPSLGFGFETVGTITNHSYEGNVKPRLGRLTKSKSLMVNKGFKNKGAKSISKKLSRSKFEIPLGISVGKTNSLKLTTQKESVEDILSALNTFKHSIVKNSYYEVNISCPNLYGDISFYPPKNLNELLEGVDKLNLGKPVFIKMPIDQSNSDTFKMLEVIVRHKVAGVVFANLQKDRKDPALDKAEVSKFKVGHFSGKPTDKRSNELIRLAYKNFGKKLVIVGCGGIFNSQDAYKKIRLGASLIQLITGLVFEGPFLVSEINKDLEKLLKKDGFKNISEAIGVDSKTLSA